jgi:hypothetical protein
MRYVNCHPPFAAIPLSRTGKRPFCCNPALLAMGFYRTSGTLLLARNFCSSCQAKRSVLFAEKLTTEILAPMPHRHWTFSIPRILRGLVERDPKLLGLL